MAVLRMWFLPMRPWSFNMSVISVALGVAWAAREVEVSWGLYAASVAAMVVLHAGGNLLNDYFDVRSGVDAVGVPTSQYRPHPLWEGRMTLGQVLEHALAFSGVALALGLWLALESGPVVLAFGAAGLLGAILLVCSLRSNTPKDADARVAKLSMAFGALLIAGVVLERIL